MKNTVELIGRYGSDRTHACSAWTSTSRELTKEKIARIPALLKQLAEAGHHTPFEKSTLHFLVRTDIATHIQMLKHRIGVSINAESARYKELASATGYIPADWPEHLQGACAEHFRKSVELYHHACTVLTPPLGRTRAKESARFLLPYSNQITSDISFNFRSFAHFLGLRAKPDAQREIRDVAVAMLDLVKQIEGNPFQHTIAAFGL